MIAYGLQIKVIPIVPPKRASTQNNRYSNMRMSQNSEDDKQKEPSLMSEATNIPSLQQIQHNYNSNNNNNMQIPNMSDMPLDSVTSTLLTSQVKG